MVEEGGPGPGPSNATVEEALARLRQSWERYALSGLGAAEAPEGGLAEAAESSVGDWRGLNAATHALIPALLAVGERLAARAAGRAWCRAAEHGPARAAWLAALGGAGELGAAAAAASEGGGLAACYARHKFLAGGAAANSFKGASTEQGEVKAAGRLRASQPVAAFWDGTAATLCDVAPVVLQPELVLTIYDMSSLTPVGVVPIAGAKHGKAVQRPLSLLSLQPARGGGGSPAQACLVALERLVVVFSWQLGGSADDEAGTFGIRAGHVEEVRWGEGGKEALRSAAFAGKGAAAPVAVLLEGKREGPVVELFGRGAGTTYVLREIVPIAPAKASAAPTPGALYGGTLALWAKSGDRTIDFVRIPPLAGAEADGAAGGAAAGGAVGAAAVFARARQAARKGRLRVGADGGAGLDLEASRWGYLVEGVDDEPGQPDVKVGDCIFAIGGQGLHGLDDEDLMHWRFGRNFADGVELTILPAEHMKAILAADSGGAAVAKAAEGGAAAVSAAHHGETLKKQHFVFSARLEAWCVAALRDPPRLVAVTDNRLVLADLGEDGCSTREALVGVARAPWKRPVERVELLDTACDVLLAGVARGVLLWRVPALLTPLTSTGQPGEPQLLASFQMPARCNFSAASLGLSLSAAPLGWVAADVTGAGASTDGGFDVWQFFAGRTKPPLQMPRTSGGGKKPGLAGDALTRAFAAVGAAADAMAVALQGAISAAGAPSGVGKEPLKGWVTKLRQDKSEALYGSVDRAEPVCGEALRELRRWLRAEGRGAAPARQDGARSLVTWVEECRRCVIWPLQEAFQAEASDSGSDDLPTRASGAANMRGTGAAAGTVPRGAL